MIEVKLDYFDSIPPADGALWFDEWTLYLIVCFVIFFNIIALSLSFMMLFITYSKIMINIEFISNKPMILDRYKSYLFYVFPRSIPPSRFIAFFLPFISIYYTFQLLAYLK